MARSSLNNVMRLIEATKTKLPPEKSFLEDLKRTIELEDSKGARKPSQTYKPSGMNCIRSMYYQVVGKEPDESKNGYINIGICGSGTDIHVRIQDAVEKMKEHDIDCEYIDVAEFVKNRGLDYLEIRERHGNEVKLYHKTLNMSFMTDGIIKYQNHYYILELKTESIYKWQSRQDVDPKHYHQGIAYSVAFGIDEVIFVYINRDLLDMKAFMFNVTDDMKQELVGLIDECDGYVKRMITPPKPDNVTRKQCEYCGYKNLCKGE